MSTVYRHASKRRVLGSLLGRIAGIDHVPGVAATTAGLLGLTMLWIAPLGSWITGVTLTTDSVPLVVAEGPSAPVLGYVGAGTTRAYVPAASVGAVLAGEVVAARGSGVGYLLAALLGAVGAGSVIVLSSCGCGTGSTAYLYETAAGAL